MHKGFCSLFPSDEFLRSPSSPRGHHPSSGRLCNGVDNRGFVWHPLKNKKSTDFKQIWNRKHLSKICGKTKTEIHPLCLMQMSLMSHWCRSRLKLLEQAQIFSACRTITLPVFCINHKAINKNKQSLVAEEVKMRRMFKPGFYYWLLTSLATKGSDNYSLTPF